MAKKDTNDVYIDIDNFKKGLHILDDTTKATPGTFLQMSNMQITDRGGVSPRYGTSLLGTDNTSDHGIKGFYNFKKSFGENEFLVKAYDDELEIYSKNNSAAGWNRLKSGFTADKEFGFVSSLVNSDNEDYMIFCNRYEEYQRWRGAVTQLNGALVGAETAVVVDSVLTPEVFESRTASASSATTLDFGTAIWAASQWINNYVYITSGVHAGKIRKITANTTTQITFDTLGSDPSTPTFEIRRAAFPATGTLVYNGTTIAYTGIPTATSFTVGSAHAAPDNTLVTIVPDVYPAAPRGNRLTNFLNRIIVGNVRSAMARDSGGALQGYSSAGSYFVSKINTPTDFSYSATRLAGEGDIVSTPYGGGEITDVSHQEDTAYIFKNAYIESVKYSQDANDLAVRDPLKAGTGSTGKTIRGQDDIYFMTPDKEFTSIGRVKTVDALPQTDNIGFQIKRLLDNLYFDSVAGIEFKGKVYITCKSSSTAENNDTVLIYNRRNKSFEGVWDIGVFNFAVFNDKPYFAESEGANVYEMLTGAADVKGSTRLPIQASCQSNFMNLTPSKATQQALNSVYFEGYIDPASTVTFNVYKDLETTPFLTFDFSGTEDGLLDGTISGSFLGQVPLALNPLGAFSDPGNDGRRHFQFRVYFPFVYGNYFSVGWNSYGTDIDYEIIRYGMSLQQTVSVDTNIIKTI